MNKIIFSGLLSGVIFTAFSPNILATNVHSAAYPSSARVQNATHHFSYNVVGNFPLENLIIKLPQGLTISAVDIEDNKGNKISSKTNITNDQAVINLGQKINPNTKIYINLRGVETDGQPNIWQYRLSGKFAGINQEIPLGLAQIRTYN